MMRPSSLQRMMSTPLTYLPSMVVSNSKKAVSSPSTVLVYVKHPPGSVRSEPGLTAGSSPPKVCPAACR